MSRIGKKPIFIPETVKVTLADRDIQVEGPKGKILRTLPEEIEVEIKEGQIFVKRKNDTKYCKALHGLWRKLIFNMIEGVTKGYTKELEIVGVGYKAQAQGQNLNLTLGFSHPVIFSVPEGIKIETPKATQIIVRGIDKELVGRVAAQIRDIYPPEPYQGKGIRYVGEMVRRKVGKATTGK